MYKDVITGFAIGLALVGCRGAEQPAPTVTHTAAPTAQAPSASASEAADASPAVATAAEEPDAAIARHLSALQNKQRCNRLMGCEPGLALLQLGTRVIPAALETLEGYPLMGHYWQIRLIKLMGQLRAVAALEPLHAALKQPRWELRVRSALALAEIADPRSLAPLRSLLDRRHDLVSDAAALHGLHALEAKVDGRPAREVLAERLPGDQAALAALNPGYFAFLAELVGAARLREGLQLARWGAMHRDRFTRMASLQTLAQLKDNEGIPYAITRLDDESPGVRRQALRTLRLITGRRAFTDPEHWQDWCEQRRCLEPIRALTAPVAPQP